MGINAVAPPRKPRGEVLRDIEALGDILTSDDLVSIGIFDSKLQFQNYFSRHGDQFVVSYKKIGNHYAFTKIGIISWLNGIECTIESNRIEQIRLKREFHLINDRLSYYTRKCEELTGKIAAIKNRLKALN